MFLVVVVVQFVIVTIRTFIAFFRNPDTHAVPGTGEFHRVDLKASHRKFPCVDFHLSYFSIHFDVFIYDDSRALTDLGYIGQLWIIVVNNDGFEIGISE